VADRIKIRRDTAAVWTSVNPILADGEIGFERDTLKIKVGNGADSWTTLPYVTGVGAFVQTTGDTMTGPLSVPALNGGQLAGHRNKVINGSGEINQRGLTSVADDTYFIDRFYVLTESGNVTVAQVTDPESGAPFGFRLTQPDVTAKRIGFATIIESKNIRQYASTAMNLFARVKLSAGTNIRYAIIEHTGTADVVTSDVVNNWASTTFTPSNFFIAGINILKTDVVTPGAATFGEIDDWVALGASVKNVILFVWSESTLVQNGTLEANRIQYEPGVIATPHEWRVNERILCERYYEAGDFGFVLPINGASIVASYSIHHPWRVVKRSVPAVSGTEDFGTFATGAVTIFGTTLGRSNTLTNRVTSGTYAASSEL
jgi:hypothetical protein